MAHGKQVVATLFTADCHDDARQDGGIAHVPETAFRTDGMQPAVCLQGAQGTGEPIPRNTLQDRALP